MILKERKDLSGYYVCNLTKELDNLSGISSKAYYDDFYHYLLVDNDFVKEKYFPIRVPGGTIGCLYYNKDFVITDIVISTNDIIETYPDNINNILQKFIGEKIEW